MIIATMMTTVTAAAPLKKLDLLEVHLKREERAVFLKMSRQQLELNEIILFKDSFTSSTHLNIHECSASPIALCLNTALPFKKIIRGEEIHHRQRM